MSIRIPESPIAVYGPGAVGNFAGLGGLGMDGFSLYVALRTLSLSQGGTGNMLVSWPFDPRMSSGNDGPHNMTSTRIMLRPQLVKGGLQIDGVCWIQVTPGNYTPVNSNQIGAYTYDGTQMTRVATTASLGTLWQAGAGFAVRAFTTPYIPPTDMVLWAAGLYNASAAVTVPQILSHQVQNVAAKNLGLQSGGTPGDTMAVDGPAAGSANLPATIADANLDNTNTNLHWLAFYHAY